MNLLKELKAILSLFEDRGLTYVLAGGLAASIYRKQVRTSDDADFLIWSRADVEEDARHILKTLGYKVLEARQAVLEGGPKHRIRNQSTPLCLLIGRREGVLGLDLILPSMKWYTRALERGRDNIVDFGNLKIPTLCVEDVIVSKCYALNNDASRFKDADDLKEIFEAGHNLDLAYLCAQMMDLQIRIPDLVKSFAPAELLRISKHISRSNRTRR